MNILIENSDTKEYLTSAGLWNKNPEAGKVFGTSRLAARAAKQEPVGKFNIVLHIPATNQFVNLDHGRGRDPLSSTTVAPAPVAPVGVPPATVV
jgi:hypothetical protein